MQRQVMGRPPPWKTGGCPLKNWGDVPWKTGGMSPGKIGAQEHLLAFKFRFLRKESKKVFPAAPRFSLKMKSFYKNKNLANTLSTFHIMYKMLT